MAYDSILHRKLNQMDAEHVLSGISSREAGWTNDSTGRELNRLFYPVAGEGWLQIEAGRMKMEPGKLYLLPGDAELSFGTEGSGSFVFYWTHYKMNMGDYNLLKELEVPFWTDAVNRQELIELFEKLIRLQQTETMLQGWRRKAALLELIACFMEGAGLERKIEAKQEVMEQFDDVLSYIEDNMSESISIEQLASIVCLHPNYFITMFKSLTGTSPVHYMNERRLEQARTLLSETDMAVADVAARIGMQNHYLSRLFKQHYGVTPRRYRELSQSIDGAVQPAEPKACTGDTGREEGLTHERNSRFGSGRNE
ncbi:helix-turn-helix transcriptional regulator [Paenibacillus kobensis]|uniref:helix-turn-helix transcriptional regulator n=1 Tax=Paenibacillus kobensis TaxID=59841 RepID=UPI0013E3CDC1|nr:AraC family transcriptional regulator [Paenibacillus kobensis]